VALGKEFFANAFFAGGSLPSAALGKGFGEGIIAFAECIRHSAKRLNPVVLPLKHAGTGPTYVSAFCF
jgi:hypothetical protein